MNTELKAEPMDSGQLDRWLSGKTPRRILMLPFGGPLPGGPKGKDIDREYFDERTDIYGPYPVLRASRERVVDWHHDDAGVPSKGKANGDPKLLSMKGAIIGHVAFDENPESDGYWADFWANAGESRRRLVAMLERRNVPLFGSTEAVKGARLLWPAEADGHIPVWPVIRHTISTSPQNTYAVVPALKAALASSLDEIPAAALKALLVGLDADQIELLLGSPDAAVNALAPVGEGAVKAGRVLSEKNRNDLRAAIDALTELLSRGELLPPEVTGETWPTKTS